MFVHTKNPLPKSQISLKDNNHSTATTTNKKIQKTLFINLLYENNLLMEFYHDNTMYIKIDFNFIYFNVFPFSRSSIK